jgi:hypothetical protein
MFSKPSHSLHPAIFASPLIFKTPTAAESYVGRALQDKDNSLQSVGNQEEDTKSNHDGSGEKF